MSRYCTNQCTTHGYTLVFVDGFVVSGSGRNPRITCIFHKLSSAPSWQARHGQSSSQYQTHFDTIVPTGYDLGFVSQYSLSGTTRYANVFSRYSVDNAWKAHHNMLSAAYQDKFDEYVYDDSYTLRYVSAGTVGGIGTAARFAAIWERTNGGPAWVARHGVTDVQAVFDEYIPQGYVPHVIDAYLESDGTLRWALLLVKENTDISGPMPNGPTYAETSCFDNIITAFMQDNDIPGAGVAVLKDGKIVYAQGYGLRDVPGIGTVVESRKAMPWTPFRLASVSKPITALAILRLVQDGALDLEDKVFGAGGWLQHMSDNPKACCAVADARIYDVRVRHLLQHTGGWDRDIAFDPMFRSDTVAETLDPGSPDKPADCEDVIYYMFGQPLQHAPGTTYAYSNFGFCILGRILVLVSGASYEQAVRTLFLDPAGVDRRQMYVGSTQLADIPGYETEYLCPGCSLTDSVFPDETDAVPNPYGAWHLEAMDAHGAWVASACQLMQMLSATAAPHCNGTDAGVNDDVCLLWSESVAELEDKLSIYASDDPTYYGLGFSVRELGSGQHRWWHGGSLPGTSTIMVRTEESYGYAWAFLANVRGYAGNHDSMMWDAVGCVGSSWPAAFDGTCPAVPDVELDPYDFPGFGGLSIFRIPLEIVDQLLIDIRVVKLGPDTAPANLQPRREIALALNEFGVNFGGWEEVSRQPVPELGANEEATVSFAQSFESRARSSIQVTMDAPGGVQRKQTLSRDVLRLGAGRSTLQLPIRNGGSEPVVLSDLTLRCLPPAGRLSSPPHPATHLDDFRNPFEALAAASLAVKPCAEFGVAAALSGDTPLQVAPGEEVLVEISVGEEEEAEEERASRRRAAASDSEEEEEEEQVLSLLLEVTGAVAGGEPEVSHVVVHVIRTSVATLLNTPQLCCLASVRTRVRIEGMLAAALEAYEERRCRAAVQVLRKAVLRALIADCEEAAEEKKCVARVLEVAVDAARLMAVEQGAAAGLVHEGDELRRVGEHAAAMHIYAKGCGGP